MASFWDDVKDLFKTKSKREEERQEKLRNALESESGLTEKLEQLDQQYRDSLPEEEEPDLEKLFPSDSGLNKIEYTPRTDEEIEKQAKALADYKKSAEENALKEKYSAQADKLDERKDEAGENLSDSYKKLEALYSDLKKKAENNSLKRGLARSSIIMGQLNNLDTAHINSAGEVEAAYNEVLSAIDGEIDALERKQDAALDELDLKYASELQAKIADLKKERDSTTAQYEKYNNSVEKQQREYAKNREEDISEYLKKREEEKLAEEAKIRANEAKYGYSGEKLQNYSERYKLAYEFYDSLSPDIAADALAASPNMRYYLGNYYDQLMNALKNKSSGTKKKY